jgi:hypothetical protein
LGYSRWLLVATGTSGSDHLKRCVKPRNAYIASGNRVVNDSKGAKIPMTSATLRERVTVAAAAFGAGGAWGSLAAILARLTTPISEVAAWGFIAIPVALLVAWLLWPRLPKILGFRG